MNLSLYQQAQFACAMWLIGAVIAGKAVPVVAGLVVSQIRGAW